MAVTSLLRRILIKKVLKECSKKKKKAHSRMKALKNQFLNIYIYIRLYRPINF